MKKYLLIATLLFAGLSGLCHDKGEIHEVWLDEFGLSPHYVQDWGQVGINKTVVGTPLTVGGKVYERGLGAHSISRLFYRLDANAVSISGLVGADDYNLFSQKMQFKIIGDRKLLWESGILRRGDSAKEFNLNLKGVKKLLLLVEECGDGIMYDHADWINVKISTRGEVTPIAVWPEPIRKEKYILTPPAPDKPKINNPTVYGARAGSPFQWSVMASGKQPMTYGADNLPEGLEIDAESGRIWGSAANNGEFQIVLHAKNECGEDSREVTIKIGETIALTPSMGWNSYNCWGLRVDEEKVMDAARLMSSKLHAYGWEYVNIDDGWQADERDANGDIVANDRFPDFQGLTDYIHSLGLKFGLYSSPGRTTCGNFPGSYGHEISDAATWARWGVDYLKYDFCSYTKIQKDSTEKTIQEPYIVMRDALDRSGRDIVYCAGYGAPNVWNWAAEAGANQWRTTRDITDEWNVVLAIGSFQDVCAQATAPGRNNDPDMLVVGRLGGAWGQPLHESLLTPDEQYTHISLWCLLSAPLLLGCDMSDMDDFTLSLVTNSEVLAIDQDALVAPARKIMTKNGQIWAKPLSDGSWAVGFFNIDPYFVMWDESEAESMQLKDYDMTLPLKELGIKGNATIRDLWRQENLDEVSGKIRVSVPYHGVKLLKVTAENK